MKGLTPVLSVPAQGDAASTTKSAIAPGTVDVRENPDQDHSTLSRDTSNALNELGRIFDKKKIEEQQELAAVFGEEAYRLAHNMKDDGSGRKILVHAAIGGIMSSITGAGFTSGAVGAGLNEAVIKEIDKIAKHDPGAAQIVSAIIGAAAAKAVGGTAGAGASAATSGTKNNLFWFVPIFAGAIGETALAGIGTELLIAGGAVVGAVIGSVGAYVIIDSFGNPIARFEEKTGQWVSEATGAPIQNISTYVKKKTVDGLSEYELPEVIVYGNKSKIRGEVNKNNTTILPESGAIFVTPPTDIKKPKVEKTPPIGDDKWREPYIENMPITEEQGAQTTAHSTPPPIDFRIPPTSTGILTGPMIYAVWKSREPNSDVWKPISEKLRTDNVDLSGWDKGSFDSVQDAVARHFAKHGAEVGAATVGQYLEMAKQWATNGKKNAKKSKVHGYRDNEIRYSKNNRYIDLVDGSSSKIVSYGKVDPSK